MVHLKGVSKGYMGQTHVLESIDLDLKKGDFLYVIGGSGAGKSTLLRMLATEEMPTQGVFSLFGYDLSQVNPATLRAIRRCLAYVPQNVRLIPDLTVLDNIAISLSLAGRRSMGTAARARMGELMERLGLIHKRDALASSLSGGEAQRVAVARALVREPELIIADEPTGAQDSDFTWSLMEFFVKENARGATVVIATHDREITRRVRRKSAILKGGKMWIDGAPLCTY